MVEKEGIFMEWQLVQSKGRMLQQDKKGSKLWRGDQSKMMSHEFLNCDFFGLCCLDSGCYVSIFLHQ
jgi:hypothetical protein